MIGVEMVADRKTKAPLDKTITRALFHEALERGLITMSYSNVIRINPPLVSPRMKRCAASISSINRLPPSRANSGSTERAVLRGAFIGFGNVAAKGHLPGWQSRSDVRIVAATDAVAARREAFLAHVRTGAGTIAWTTCCRAKHSISWTSARRRAAMQRSSNERWTRVFTCSARNPWLPRWGTRRSWRRPRRRAGRIVHTVHNWLKAPICLKISALIAEGAIGAVRSVSWQTLRTQPAVASTPTAATNWRVDPAMAGGGILFDHGWHALYCVARWAGAPRGVAALLETRRFHEWPLEDTATLPGSPFGVATSF